MRGQFERLQQDHMTVTVYEMRFTKLSFHAAFFISTKAKKVRQLIKRLTYGIKITMAQESEIWNIFYWAV